MFKKSILTLLLTAAVSHAAVKELIPNLKSDDLNVQTQARLDLLAVCSEASAPDAADGAREVICLEICEVLNGNYPVIEVIQPMLNNLERIGGEESVQTLSKLMNHEDENIRDDARRALVVNPSAKAGEVLKAELMRSPPGVTAGLIAALGERKESGVSKLIAGNLANQDQEIFLATVKALGRLNEDAGVEAMMDRRGLENGFRLVQLNSALLASGRTTVFVELYSENESDEVRAAALLALLLDKGSLR